MNSEELSILVYGYGNPSRGDDGLGIFFAEEIEKKQLPRITVETNYQLNAEDALLISEKDIVIFADATQKSIDDDYLFHVVKPAPKVSFTTHAMAPQSVVALCHELYTKQPDTYIMVLQGYAWELGEEITQKSKEKCFKAVSFLTTLIEKKSRDLFKQCARTDVSWLL